MLINDLKERALALKQLYHPGISIGGGAGLFAAIQILNPAASGRHVAILSATFTSRSGAGTSVGTVYRHDTALTTLYAQTKNAWLGNAAAVFELRHELLAAQLGTVLESAHIGVGTPMETGLYVLEPGQGLYWTDVSGNIGLGFQADVWEYIP